MSFTIASRTERLAPKAGILRNSQGNAPIDNFFSICYNTIKRLWVREEITPVFLNHFWNRCHMNEYIFSCDNLTKRYRDFAALNNFTMHIPKGAIYGFVGKNGAGKTTLIRLLCGLQKPTAGSYTLFGIPNSCSEIKNARCRIGAIVEAPALYLDMTAEENLCQQYKLLGLSSFSDIKKLLNLVGLSDTGRKKVKHFSMGMRQRLGIAVALCKDPEFLVLDEPINGLDPEGIIEVRELILRLNRERGTTVLISSHILDELSRLATHYGIIDHGQMIQEMRAEEIESARRKCVRLDVTDIGALTRVLDKAGMEYKIISDNTADIYSEVSVSKLVTALSSEGCEIKSMHDREESLESYYLSLLGGNRNA